MENINQQEFTLLCSANDLIVDAIASLAELSCRSGDLLEQTYPIQRKCLQVQNYLQGLIEREEEIRCACSDEFCPPPFDGTYDYIDNIDEAT